jgi:ribose transport system substrate-binding protein
MKKVLGMVFILALVSGTLFGAGNKEASKSADKEGYKIAFSNSYVGNAWRTASVNIFDAYTDKLVEQGVIAEAYSSSAGNDVQAQINEIRNMMSEGYDAIVTIAASATGLNSILEEAADRGIVVVCFDANVDSDLVYNVNTDQFEYGRLLAQSLADRMNGSGNILWIQGIEGNAVTINRSEGMQSVLDNYPGIKVLGKAFGMWDDSTTAVEMANLMSAYSDQGIDGILSEGGGGHAIVMSLQEYGYDPRNIPISEGEMFNSFMKDWVEMDLDAFCIAQPPYLSAASVDVALRVLKGEKVEPWTIIDLPTCSSREEAEAKWYQPEQEGNFACAWTDNANTWGLSVEDIAPKK